MFALVETGLGCFDTAVTVFNRVEQAQAFMVERFQEDLADIAGADTADSIVADNTYVGNCYAQIDFEFGELYVYEIVEVEVR